LKNTANPNIKDDNGNTAKHWAYDGDGRAVEHYKKCYNLLVQAMQDKDIK